MNSPQSVGSGKKPSLVQANESSDVGMWMGGGMLSALEGGGKAVVSVRAVSSYVAGEEVHD